jgi:HD-GYP domain-containing protein (c-di-GMP phosphodiesterase class II)
MDIDSYESPSSQRLLAVAQERHADTGPARAVLITESVAALAFLACAVPLALLVHSPRSLAVAPLALCVAVYLVAGQVKFPVGSAWTAPTQLGFVPMLFVLPTPVVPLVVAGCMLVRQLPRLSRGEPSLSRVLAAFGDSWFALGPAAVLVLAHAQVLSWHRWPVLVAALAAQFAADAGAGLSRSWFAERIAPAEQLPMLWLYLTDASLSFAALAIASKAIRTPALVLATLPLIGLMWMFAREREQRIEQSQMLTSAYRGTALLLGEVVEADDAYTGIHSREVVDLASAMATALGLNATQSRNVEFTALLHDVGKIHVPEQIINKPGPLTDSEWEVLRRHTIDGERMLRQVGGTLAGIGRFVRASHERFDGCGYPDALAGEAIPLEARIVAVCDAYNAMTTDRPYRSAMPVTEALAELERGAGSQFDPAIVERFQTLMAPAAIVTAVPTPPYELASLTGSRQAPRVSRRLQASDAGGRDRLRPARRTASPAQHQAI